MGESCRWVLWVSGIGCGGNERVEWLTVHGDWVDRCVVRIAHGVGGEPENGRIILVQGVIA